jgi:dephospho-CoA kinase
MPAIGITGGISTGKTTFCDCLRKICPNAKFFNADAAARELVDLDEEVKRELLREFGLSIFLRSGSLNREALRAIIFADAAKRSALEQILHPRIRRQWSAEANKHRNAPEFFFADIPLLYETGGETLCDRVVVVACSREIQLERLLQRGKIDRAAAEKIIDAQMPLSEKMNRADQVAWNNGDRALLAEQAQMLMQLWRV